jgi:subtilisin family serine protease
MRLSRRWSAFAIATAAVAALAAPTATADSAGPADAPHTRAVPAPLHDAQEAIPGQYIVTLTPGTDPKTVTDTVGVTPRFVYRNALLGFAARLTEPQLALVRSIKAVTAVEQDSTLTVPPEERMATGTSQRAGTGIPWGLERINQRAPSQLSGFTVKATGAGVSAYILDSGIDYTHPEFGGRAVPGTDQSDPAGKGEDCAGHGTHVAGTVGGTTTGVARQATLVSVKVLDCSNAGPNSGIIAGINWVAAHANKPAVANLSLGGYYSPSMNSAVDGLARSGVFPVVAAGNDDTNACITSPASAAHAFTVSATDQADRMAPFSNYGSCVNLSAPGVGITSAYLGGSYTDMDGTSMAAPHVTGIAALYKATYGDAPFETLKKWLLDNATPDVPLSAPWGTPRKLAFTGGL